MRIIDNGGIKIEDEAENPSEDHNQEFKRTAAKWED